MVRRLGRMRHWITFQVNTPTQNAGGQPIESWGTFGDASDVPAELIGATGGETQRGRQVSATANVVVRTRYLADVTNAMRISVDGRTLNIVSAVDRDGMKREMWIDCREDV